jgi:hypothetical protein
MRRLALVVVVLCAACAGDVTGGPPAGDDGGGPASGDGGGPGPGADAAAPPPDTTVQIPLDPGVRPVDIMPMDRLALVASRMPRVGDEWLKGILESTDTMWYDRFSIIPGYQDSYGNNIDFPVGMRPNTIDPGLIAVAGGHGFIFQDMGVFHFPFGRPAGFTEEDGLVVDFWHVPREAGELLPVVWWWREPTSWHHRIEWMFPEGSVLGEVLFELASDGTWHPFEIRTRERRVDGWTTNAYRPFPTAEDLAGALEAKRQEHPSWAGASDITALIDHLRNPATLAAAQLGATHFDGTFPTIQGARDQLPGVGDPTILMELLMETPFVSARGAVWKENGSLTTYAASTQAGFHIVPRGYNAGFIAVDDEQCNRCHRDAGHPFRDFYPSIMLYGELWGEDQIFSWHPFLTSSFVDPSSGEVIGFGPPDNRRFRPDFESSGVLEEYDPARHGASTWRELPADWKPYTYD